jgi:hypothetical protein
MLSLNGQLMGIATRLRQFHREKHLAVKTGHLQVAQTPAGQIASIEMRVN